MTNRGLALTLFFLSGALALAYQVVWTRYLVLLLGASTPVVSIVIGVFMAGLALGARLIGAVADRHPAPMKLYGLLEAGIGALRPRASGGDPWRDANVRASRPGAG